MKKIIFIMLACFFMITAGCSTTQKPVAGSSDKSKQSVASCKRVCIQRMQACSKKTGVKCENCQIEGTKKALSRYKHYLNERCIEGAVVFRELNSMRDPLKCLKVSTNCCADLNVCLQYCDGKIYKQMLPAARCCNS